MTRVTITAEQAKNIQPKSNWNEFDLLSDNDINNTDDPDVKVLSEEQLKNLKPAVHRGGGIYAHPKDTLDIPTLTDHQLKNLKPFSNIRGKISR